jgi:hypothetical protein
VALKIALSEVAHFDFSKGFKPLYQWFRKCTLSELQYYESNCILELIGAAGFKLMTLISELVKLALHLY